MAGACVHWARAVSPLTASSAVSKANSRRAARPAQSSIPLQPPRRAYAIPSGEPSCVVSHAYQNDKALINRFALQHTKFATRPFYTPPRFVHRSSLRACFLLERAVSNGTSAARQDASPSKLALGRVGEFSVMTMQVRFAAYAA
jgi:hypothetical protein